MDDHEDKIHRSANELVELRAALKQMQARLDRLGLTVKVLKEMLVQPDAEAEFLRRLSQAAAEKSDANVCQKCGKAMSSKHTRCMYCGEARSVDIF